MSTLTSTTATSARPTSRRLLSALRSSRPRGAARVSSTADVQAVASPAASSTLAAELMRRA